MQVNVPFPLFLPIFLDLVLDSMDRSGCCQEYEVTTLAVPTTIPGARPYSRHTRSEHYVYEQQWERNCRTGPLHWRQQLLVVGELGLAAWDSHQWDSVPLPPTEIATSSTRSTPSSSRPPPFIPSTIFQLVNRIKCENSNNKIRFFQKVKKFTMTWLPRLELLRWDQICKISRRHYNKDNIEQDVFGQ